MGDWIGLGIFLLVVVGALSGLAHLGKRPKPLTEAEYERRVAEARGATRGAAVAGLYALQKLLNPKAVEAIEVQRDLKAGFYNDAEKKGGGGAPGMPPEGLNPESEEGTDA